MKKIYIVSALALMYLPLTVFGQTQVIPQGIEQPGESVTIASVSIENLSYSYDDTSRKMKLDFNLLNEGESINGVNFSVTVRSENGASREYLYSKNLFIGSKQSLAQSVEEVVPSYIFGTSSFMLQAVTSSGMPLSARLRDGISIKKAIADTTYLDSNSCYLTVSGPTKYNLVQGVDLDQTEQLVLNCNVTSTSKSTFTLTPSLKTYERSTLGKFIEEIKLSPISVKGGTSIVKIPIKIPSTPQAYSSIISINNGTDSIGEVGFHYVVRGESGTVNLVQTDKASYVLGDTAMVKLRWSPRADGFPGSRIGTTTSVGTLNGMVYMTSNGSPCGDPAPFTPSKADEQNYVINLVMKTECNGFNTRVEVRDPVTNAVIVDTSFDTPKVTSSAEPKAGQVNWIQYMIAIGALLVALILMIILIKVKKSRTQSKAILIIAIAFASFGVVQSVGAAVLTVVSCRDGDCYPQYLTGEFETLNAAQSNTSTFNNGDTISIRDYKNKQYLRCGNSGGYVTVTSKVTIKKSNSTVSSTGYRALCDSTDLSLCYNNYTWTPSSVGTYVISVTFKVTEGTNSVYSVISPQTVAYSPWFGFYIVPAVYGSNEFTISKTIIVKEPEQNLSLNFTGSGASYGKVNLTGTTPTPCKGPGPCNYKVGQSGTVNLTAVSRGTDLDTSKVSCSNSLTTTYNVFRTAGSISGGVSPYTYMLRNVKTSSGNNVADTEVTLNTTKSLSKTYNLASAYLEITSSDKQVYQKSCGGTAVPPLTDTYILFNGWSGDCSGRGTCTLGMSTNRTVWADYSILRANNGAPTLSASLDSGCYDITGSKPIQISISASDPDNDGLTLQVSYGGAYANSGSPYAVISFAPDSIGTKYIAIRVIDSYGASSNEVSFHPNVVANCNPAPTVTLTASPTQVDKNSFSLLSWTSTNATACVTAGDWVVSQTATSSSGSGYGTGPLTVEKNYTYSISCTGLGGKSATSTATVAVNTPMTLTCTPSKTAVNSRGEDVTFTANIVGTSRPNYNWQVIANDSSHDYTTMANSLPYLVSNYIPDGSAPIFNAVDSSPTQRNASVTCARLPEYVPVNMSCLLMATPQHLFITGNTKLSWTSTNATSCSINNVPTGVSNVPTGSLGSGNMQIITSQTGLTRFTMTCHNPLAANTTCISLVDVTVGDGTADAILWFDSQFTGQNGAPSLTAIQAKPPLTVNLGTDVTIKTNFDTNVIESCTGVKISGPSGAAMDNWAESAITDDNSSVTLEGSGLSIGTYELGLSCKGYTPAGGTASTYPSDNKIRLKVINSVLREI